MSTFHLTQFLPHLEAHGQEVVQLKLHWMRILGAFDKRLFYCMWVSLLAPPPCSVICSEARRQLPLDLFMLVN